MLLLQHYHFYFFFSDASVVGAAPVPCKAVTYKGWRCLLSQLLVPFLLPAAAGAGRAENSLDFI